MYDSYGMQGDKYAKAVKDVLIKLGGEDDTINVLYAETEGNQGALDYFGLTEKVLLLVLCTWEALPPAPSRSKILHVA